MRIRHYGFLANRGKRKNLGLCRLLMNVSPDSPVVQDQSAWAIMLAQAGIDIVRCPCCKQGTMRKIYEIPEGSGDSAFTILRPVSLSNKDP